MTSPLKPPVKAQTTILPIDSARRLAQRLDDTHFRLATVESCTGGLLAGSLTSLAGASSWFEGGFITYRLTAKQHLLGIHADTLNTFGAVSEVVATQMVQHTLAQSATDLAIATTGIAGPSSDSTATPVGTLWIAWAGVAGTHRSHEAPWCDAQCFKLSGSRQAFREQAVALSIDGLLSRLRQANPLPDV